MHIRSLTVSVYAGLFLGLCFNKKIYYIFFTFTEKRVDPNGRVYFVNHKNRTTQWEDPRTQG